MAKLHDRQTFPTSKHLLFNLITKINNQENEILNPGGQFTSIKNWFHNFTSNPLFVLTQFRFYWFLYTIRKKKRSIERNIKRISQSISALQATSEKQYLGIRIKKKTVILNRKCIFPCSSILHNIHFILFKKWVQFRIWNFDYKNWFIGPYNNVDWRAKNT